MGWRQWLAILAILVGVLLGVHYILPYVAPFILGIFLSSLIEPMVRWIEKSVKSRRIATWVVFGWFIAFFVAVLLWAIGGATREIRGLLQELPRTIQRFHMGLAWLNQHLPPWSLTSQPEINRIFIQAVEGLLSIVSRFVLDLAGWLEKLPGIFGSMALAFVAAFFFTRDKVYWQRFIRRLLPTAFLKVSKQLANELLMTVLQMVRMEIVMMAWTFLLSGITLFGMGYERPWFFALLIAILEPLPMMGPAVILLPWSGWLMAMGQWRFALIIMALSGVIFLSRQWGELHFVGKKLGLNPLWTIMGIAVGFQCFGVLGLWIGPMILLLMRTALSILLATNFDGEKPIDIHT